MDVASAACEIGDAQMLWKCFEQDLELFFHQIEDESYLVRFAFKAEDVECCRFSLEQAMLLGIAINDQEDENGETLFQRIGPTLCDYLLPSITTFAFASSILNAMMTILVIRVLMLYIVAATKFVSFICRRFQTNTDPTLFAWQ